MAIQVQQRGGTTTEHSSFTGAARELTIDTTKNTVVVHDGSTAGGIPLAKEAGPLTNGGATKLATTSSGINVTGSVTADGLTVGDGEEIRLGASTDMGLFHSGGVSQIRINSGIFKIRADDMRFTAQNGTTEHMRIDSSGRVLVGISGASGFGQLETTTFTTEGQCILARAGGNVGIGVTPESDWSSVTAAFQIGSQGSMWEFSGVDKGLYLSDNSKYTSSGYAYINSSEASLHIQQNGIHYFRVAPSGTADTAISWTTAMTIDNAGVTHWGTFSATGATNGKRTLDYGKTDYSAEHSGNYYPISFANPNGYVGSIKTSGSATSYNTSSDYRLKENVVPMSGSIDRLKALKPSRFNFIADTDKTVDGFLAHEAGEVVPECVSGEKDAMRMEDYEVTPALGDVFTPAVEEVSSEQPVMETVEGDVFVNLAGETITETSQVGVTTEVIETVIERQSVDGVLTEVEVDRVSQEPVLETVVTIAAVAEIISSSNVEKPAELTDGQQWREVTPAITGEREVPDMQGIDQAKLVPLLASALQEAVARIEQLENA